VRLFAVAEERLACPNDRPFPQRVTQLNALGREDEHRRAVLEVAHLLALAERRVRRDPLRTAVPLVQHDVEEVKRMLATRTAATGTSVSDSSDPRGRMRTIARSFLQNSRGTRFSAGGFTFHTSPGTYTTSSTSPSAGRGSGDTSST